MSGEEGRAEVREQIERLEAVKDFIIGFLEASPVRDAATREMWVEDAKEAFYDVVSAYDALRAGKGEKEERAASATSLLEMARSRVNQVSSELKAFNTDVAEDLCKRLIEAFEGASQAISLQAGAKRPPGGPPSKAVDKLGEDSYVLLCSSCGKVAAVFRTDVPKLSTTEEKAILFEGVTRSNHFDMTNAGVIFERLEQGNVRGLNDYVEHLVEGGVDAYCPNCDRAYCKDHWDLEEEWDEGFYDCTYGTCPEGHRRLLDD